MRQFGLRQKRPVLSHPHPHAGGKLRTLFFFLPPPSLPFLFLKKIAARQKGPSCGGLWLCKALSKAPPVLGTLSRKAWAAWHNLKVPRRPQGSSNGASQCTASIWRGGQRILTGSQTLKTTFPSKPQTPTRSPPPFSP